jgi:hypothetical protein
LTTIIIPDSVVVIDGETFSDCDSLTDVVSPKELRAIGDNAFGLCQQLKTIHIRDSATHIRQHVFCECPNLATVRLPQNAQLNIDINSFSGCPSLFQVQTPKLMTQQQRMAIIDQISGTDHRSFQYVGLNNVGCWTFLAHVPILLLPNLLEHSPRSCLW